ncbi:MAG: hypothetical protein M3Q45_08585, partial [Chloroflexota bacterium]|nr:hypothetical protein [Chloroflexota bacterium]
AAYAQFATLPPFLTPADLVTYQQWRDAVQAELGQAAYATAWAAGQARALDQTVAYALTDGRVPA